MGRWNNRRSLLDRFEEKVSKHPGHWIWNGAVTRCPNGDYGTLLFECGKQGNILAHRAAWILYCGKIPSTMNVLHRCDLPICVNPSHLFLGTQADNMNDCKQKGRLSSPPIHHGASHHKAKLSNAIAERIRVEYRNNAEQTQRGLASKYEVSQSTIGKILRDESWVGGLK